MIKVHGIYIGTDSISSDFDIFCLTCMEEFRVILVELLIPINDHCRSRLDRPLSQFYIISNKFKNWKLQSKIMLATKYEFESLNSPYLHLFIWSPAGLSNLSTREKRREYEMTRLQRSSCLTPPTASYYPTHRETLLIFNFANWPTKLIKISAIWYGLQILS